jgi:hypothetical protein
MPVGSVSQNIASQIEHVRDTLEELVLLQGVLRKRINKATDITAISNRPARIPFNVLTGGIFRTGTNLFDGGDMGRGSAPTQTFGTLSAVSFLQASEYTALSEYATDSTEKAIENYVTLTNRQATETYAGYMDSLICQSDGSNTLDTVVSTTTNGLVVNNADIFQDNQLVDVWSALGGTLRGTAQILSIDIANNTIWLTSAIPAGTIAGDLLLVTGSAGVANSGLFGIPYYHVAGNAGNYMGIPRASFPGKFSTPNVNPGTSASNTGALTPASVRAMQAQIDLAMGIDASDDEVVAHMNVDMAAAWENNALPVQSIIYNEMQGDSSADMLKKRQTTTIAGREILRNIRARVGRIDFLNFKHWFRLETKALDMYEVGGQTLFPTYGASGGLNSTMIFYLCSMEQYGLGQPRREAFMSNITIPKSYFGH